MISDAAPRNADLEGLLTRFVEWGRHATIEGYVDLFTPGGTLMDSGMSEPISGEQIREAIAAVLGLLPDLQLSAIRTGRNETTLFVEAENRATLNGREVTWAAVYCMTAEGDRVVRGRRYWDQSVLLEALTGRVPDEAPHPAAGPISLTPTAVVHGEARTWFREWVGTAAPTGSAVPFGAVERHADGETCYFYNRLLLRPVGHAQMAALAQQPDLLRSCP